jgi:hypothetical protein
MPPLPVRLAAVALALSGNVLAQTAAPLPAPTQTAALDRLDRIEIFGNYNNAVGTSDAASQGTSRRS